MAPFAGFTKVDEHHGVVDGYILNQKIGQGNFGEVFACSTPNGRVVAVKKMPKSKLLTIKTMSSLSSELRILRNPDLSQRHPNILYIDDVLQSRSNLYIVMPMVGQVSSGGRGDIGQARTYTSTCVCIHVHRRCCCHIPPPPPPPLPPRTPTLILTLAPLSTRTPSSLSQSAEARRALRLMRPRRSRLRFPSSLRWRTCMH